MFIVTKIFGKSKIKKNDEWFEIENNENKQKNEFLQNNENKQNNDFLQNNEDIQNNKELKNDKLIYIINKNEKDIENQILENEIYFLKNILIHNVAKNLCEINYYKTYVKYCKNEIKLYKCLCMLTTSIFLISLLF